MIYHVLAHLFLIKTKHYADYTWVDSEGVYASDSKFHFHGKKGKFGTQFLILLFDKSVLLPMNVCKIAG